MLASFRPPFVKGVRFGVASCRLALAVPLFQQYITAAYNLTIEINLSL